MSGKNEKSLVVAGALGLVFPGLGLLYAAPWSLAIIATIVVAVAYKLLSWIPILGPALMGVIAIASALLGMLYAKAYNREGKRISLQLPQSKH